jgi:hypothetical protein
VGGENRETAEPGVYLEKVLPSVLAAINAIMDATPVETLPGVDKTKLTLTPPGDQDVFRAHTRERIRLLSGVA